MLRRGGPGHRASNPGQYLLVNIGVSNVNIITNNHQRQMACLAELTDKVRAEFDYVNEDERYCPRFVRYLGRWYDVYDSQSVTRELGFDQFKGWDGIVSETYFSGVVFRWGAEDTVIVGRYFT
jgi:hypothetical protein